MRAVSFTTRLLLLAPLGVLLNCAGDNGGAAASGVGGSHAIGGNSNATVGGTVSTGGVASGGTSVNATGGTIASATGGTTASATGGSKANATGGSKANATGGSKANATGGSKASAVGGTTASATGGTKASATGGTAGGVTGGTKATATGGSTGNTGGATGTAGSTAYPLGNTPVPSSGCGKALPSAYKAGADTTFKDMTSAGIKREYIVYIPTGYDPSKPYKLLFAWHCMGSSDTGAVSSGYYGAKQQDTGKTTILVAPQGYTDTMPWRSDDKDHTFFDDMLKLFKSDLCIDESRVFSVGFSFGGMETYSLSVDRQKDIRAGVGIAPANYNIYVPKTKTHLPIAWMQTTGMSDCTCPWVQGQAACGSGTPSTTNGSKFIAIEHGTDNGCTVPATIPTWTSGNHLCVDFAGCKPEYPTKICTFNGGHTDTSSEGGSNWIYTEAWKFFTQF